MRKLVALLLATLLLVSCSNGLLGSTGTTTSTNTTTTTKSDNTSEQPSDDHPYDGMSVVFVGDSITYGTGTEKTYHSYLGEMINFSSVSVRGVPGSCFSAKSDYSTANSPLVNRYSDIPDADLIIVFMGTNDYGHETPLGTPSDTTDISFYGALKIVISSIHRQHPASTLVFVTPLHRYGFGTSKILNSKFTYDYLPNGRGFTLGEYVEAIKDVCRKYSVPVIDLFNQCPINPANDVDRNLYFPDGLHPNFDGHRIIAECICEALIDIPKKEYDGSKPDDESEEISMQFGNKFVANFANDSTRASSVINIYLEKGTTVLFKYSETYKWALAKTGNKTSNTYTRYYPNNGWNSDSSYTIAESGYYGLVLVRLDGSPFDFGGADFSSLSDYLEFQ